MPFTPTHIAAAFPIAKLWRQPGVLTALIIGTMCPDWALYLPIGTAYDVKSVFSVGFLNSVFVGVVATMVFIGCMKKPLMELMPNSLRHRLQCYRDVPVALRTGTILRITVAVIFGAATHIAWDALTHDGTVAMTLFPLLREEWRITENLRMPGYSALQHGSTLIVMPALIVLYLTWFRNAKTQVSPVRRISNTARYTWLFLAIFVPAALISVYISELERVTFGTLANALYLSSIEAGRAVIVIFSTYTLFFYPLVHKK